MFRFSLSRGQRKLLLAIGLPLLFFLLLRYFLPLVLPTLLAFLLCRPLFRLTDFLIARWRFPRSLAAGIVLAGAAALLAGGVTLLCWRLSKEAGLLLQEIPLLLDALPDTLDRLRDWLQSLLDAVPGYWQQYLTDFIESMLSRGLNLPTRLYEFFSSFLSETLLALPVAALFLTILLLSGFFLCRDHAALSSSLLHHLPASWLQQIRWLKTRCEQTVFHWLKVQGLLILSTFSLLLAGLLLMGNPAALFLSLCIALLDALPIIGAGTALLPWALLSFLTGRFASGLGLLALWGACWLCRTLLEPRLLSRRLGLHPLWTLMAVYIGFRLSGVWGMLLYPLFVVLLREVYHWGLPEDTQAPEKQTAEP